MTDKTNPELLKFPCEFHYKVVGTNNSEFAKSVKDIFASDFDNNYKMTEKTSKSSKFISFNVAITATSRSQLDATYKKLHAVPGVQIVL
jgi:putative lipoic acid-binding regulatory protein